MMRLFPQKNYFRFGEFRLTDNSIGRFVFSDDSKHLMELITTFANLGNKYIIYDVDVTQIGSIISTQSIRLSISKKCNKVMS